MKLRTVIVLFFLALLFHNRVSAQYSDHRNRGVDSLEQVLLNNPPSSSAHMIVLYDNLAWGYLELNEHKSTQYALAGLAIAQEIKDYRLINGFHRILGMHHWGHARYDQAEAELKLAMDAVDMMRECGKYNAKEIDNQASALYGTLGNLYNSLGQGAKALDYYHRALHLFEKYDWKENKVIAYGNMAELYLYMGNLNQAMDYYLMGDSIAGICQDSLMQSYALKGLSKIALANRQYNKAWRYIQPAYDYLSAHPDEEGSSFSDCLVGMADIAIEQQDWERAELLIRENDSVCAELDYCNVALLNQKAVLAGQKGQWRIAEQYAIQAAQYDTDAPDVARKTYRLLADVYLHLNSPELVKLYTTKADSIQSAWSSYAYQTSLAEQEARFETEKKDMKILALAREKQLMYIVLATVAVLLVALVIMLVLSSLNYKKQKALLAARVALETETREREILAKDLHDGLGGMLSLLKLKMENNEHDEARSLIDESARELRRVAHHIMPDELLQKGLVTSLSNFAISVPGAHFHYYPASAYEQNLHPIPANIELVLYRCAYELVNNAIKHASAQRIDIQLFMQEKQVLLTISDNGKGFDQEQITGGMGLKNIRNRIAQFNGQMDIISQPGAGTEINIAFPL